MILEKDDIITSILLIYLIHYLISTLLRERDWWWYGRKCFPPQCSVEIIWKAGFLDRSHIFSNLYFCFSTGKTFKISPLDCDKLMFRFLPLLFHKWLRENKNFFFTNEILIAAIFLKQCSRTKAKEEWNDNKSQIIIKSHQLQLSN